MEESNITTCSNYWVSDTISQHNYYQGSYEQCVEWVARQDDDEWDTYYIISPVTGRAVSFSCFFDGEH